MVWYPLALAATKPSMSTWTDGGIMGNTAELLKGVDLFSSLSDEQIEIIAQVAVEKEYKKDENIIIEDDDTNHGFFLIAEGEVKVFLCGSDGRETILSLLGNGDFFGEMSLIDGEPRSASVKATMTSRLISIRREDFLLEMERFPDLAMSMMTELCHRIRKANKQISSLATLSVFGRIAGTLESLAEERGKYMTMETGRSVIVIHHKPTQQQLAEMSGTTRETVSRVLTQLKQRGTISMAGKDLFILEPGELTKKEG